MRENHKFIVNCDDCDYTTKAFSSFKQHAEAKGHSDYYLTEGGERVEEGSVAV